MTTTATGRSTPTEPSPHPRRRRAGVLLGIVAAAVVAGAGVGWLSGRDDGSAGVAVDDPGVVHVHGLGVNPADGALYAATHTGLFRVDRGSEVERVADRYQDTMGFAVAGPDRFLASGHPDLRDEEMRVEGKPPLLGLIESADAGRTWQVRSLLGDADLHAIGVVGDVLVAYDSTGERVLVSSDGGREWETRAEIGLVELTVDPRDADRLAAIRLDGDVQISDDGGRTLTSADDAPGGLVVLRWGDDALWAGADDGTLYRADPGDGRWDEVRRFDGRVEALLEDDGSVYVAAVGTGIWMSSDDGRTWRQLYRPPA